MRHTFFCHNDLKVGLYRYFSLSSALAALLPFSYTVLTLGKRSSSYLNSVHKLTSARHLAKLSQAANAMTAWPDLATLIASALSWPHSGSVATKTGIKWQAINFDSLQEIGLRSTLQTTAGMCRSTQRGTIHMCGKVDAMWVIAESLLHDCEQSFICDKDRISNNARKSIIVNVLSGQLGQTLLHIVVTVETDLRRAFGDRPCALRCQANTTPSSTAKQNPWPAGYSVQMISKFVS